MFLKNNSELKIECILKKSNFSIFYKIGIDFFLNLIFYFESEIDNRLLFVIDGSVDLSITYRSQLADVVKLDSLIIAFLDKQLSVNAIVVD